MAIGLALPTAKRRKHTATTSSSPNNNNNKHKCRIRLKDPTITLPEFDIELYWKKERQWWYLDRTTILHEFRYNTDSDERGVCVASWRCRKNVKFFVMLNHVYCRTSR